MRSNRLQQFLIPLLAVLLGMIAGSVVMLASGYNPVAGFGSLIYGAFGDAYYIGETIRQTTPYILTGLAVAFAFRTGLFNIGVEGQLIVGWLAAVWVGVSFDLPKIIHLPLAILAAALAGALWGLLPGVLKAYVKVHEVIITIMMNYIALHVTNAIIRSVLSDEGFKSDPVKESASLQSEFLESITYHSTMHYGILIAIAAAFVMWFLLERTTKGFELRAVGFNQHASQYAGMNVRANIILAMVISGAFAGVAGAMEGLGTFGNISTKAGFTGLGFDGIAVALIGSNNAFGILLSALLFGALKVGSLEMPSGAGVPTELVDIIIALIIFFVASSYMIRWLLSRWQKGAE
ncbi:branched-chain amino acid ABC transporter permease [Geobacillus sp. 46C-IIa]|uniref:ABC transporter permease n=1 Tax=Geobacillus sp. 46C-IIa TaxID=1963025 RepID=UPI0009BD207E|nr:ABC transporter permease [Geobacillus sp. 46C-IIa]OQP08047.1 branched-chain amino acid ABC transporter permease [Geobacillus sp. 46C-IIa]QNU26794.1 ABC transporter permease [Geobacillus sp. 46C-IIa]